jgi:hypothetical protein
MSILICSSHFHLGVCTLYIHYQIRRASNSLTYIPSHSLIDPSATHVEIAIRDTGEGKNPEPQLLFDKYPFALLKFIAPRVRALLAEREERLSAAIAKDSKECASNSKGEVSEGMSARKGSSASVATISTLPTTSTSVPPPRGVVLDTSAPRALQLILDYAILSCTPKPGAEVNVTYISLSEADRSYNDITLGPYARIPSSRLSIPLSDHAFYKYSRIVDEAKFCLGWTWLANLLEKRMHKIMSGQVHTNCVARILEMTDPLALKGNARKHGGKGAWVRKMCVESIARAAYEGRLQVAFKYDELRRQYPEFDQEVEKETNQFVRTGACREA